MTHRRPFRPLLAALLVAAACGRDPGAETVVPAAPPPPAGPAGDFVVTHTTTGGPGAPAPREKDPAGTVKKHVVPPSAPCGVELTLTLSSDVVAWGEPVPARVAVVNRTKAGIHVWDLQGDLARRLEIRHEVGGRLHSVTQGLPASLAAYGAETTELRPDIPVEFDVDLAPWLRRAQGFCPGRFRFVAAWAGDRSVVPATFATWNADPKNLATARETVLEVLPPRWLARFDAHADVIREVMNDVVRWSPGTPSADEVLARTRRRGPAALGALAFIASCGDLASLEADLRAGRAMRMLREIGPAALDAVRAADTPACRMTAAVIEGGLDPDGDASEAAAAARRIGGGTDDATSFQVSVRGRGEEQPWLASIDARANVIRVRNHGEPDQQSVLRPLTATQLSEVKRAILAARPWAWRRLREGVRIREGMVSFSLSCRGRTLWTITIPGDEARRGNPFAADVLAAFERLPGGPAPAALAAVRRE